MYISETLKLLRAEWHGFLKGFSLDIWKNFNRQYADLYRFARRILCNHESAEDITQEAMFRFARDKAGKLDGEPARKWLFTVARNLCISRLRKESGRNEITLKYEDITPSSKPAPPDMLITDEKCRIIEQAISRLPHNMREVIVLREYEGMDYKEISGFIDCPVGTVRSRLARARSELKKHLAPYMEDNL